MTSETRKLLLEGAVIVSSILLAFGIDAAWDGHVERRAGRTLTTQISADITQTRAIIAGSLLQSNEVSSTARRVLAAIGKPASPARDSALSLVGGVFVTSTFHPNDDTFQEAIGAGRLTLLEPETRIVLSLYQRNLDNVRNLFEAMSRQYYEQQEPFMVSNAIYTDLALQAWRDALPTAPFRTNYDALARSEQLWNLVTLRLELEAANAAYLGRVDSLAIDVLKALGAADTIR